MGSVGVFNLFVTNAEKSGVFLKVWGQKDHSSALQVERLILQHFESFESGQGIPDPKTLQVDVLCCARFTDGSYYRARIVAVDQVSGTVTCVFIDYGNTDRVPFSSIRILESMLPLFRYPAQASSFILSGVVGNWDKPIIRTLMEKIGYEEVKCMVLKTIGPSCDIHLLKMYMGDHDFTEYLVSTGFATPIPPEQFEVMVWNNLTLPAASLVNLPSNYMYQNPIVTNQQVPLWQQMVPGPNFVTPSGVTAPPVPVTAMPFNSMLPNGTGLAQAHLSSGRAAMPPSAVPSPVPVPASRQYDNIVPVDMRKTDMKTVEALTRFKPIHLENDSEHLIYVSHVEKGTFSFAVQLSENDNELERMVAALNNPATTYPQLKHPYLPGTICLARYSEDDSIYRGVITEVQSDKCVVYFVDYGNSDSVKCHDLFEIPAEFTLPKVMAVQFTLAGLGNIHRTDEMLQAFYDLVLEKDATLKVVPPKCQELTAKQLGELFIDDNNVKELINAEILSKRQKTPDLMYRNMALPETGSKVKVVVSYVKSLDNFYIQLASLQNDLESMMAIVAQHCNGHARRLHESEIKPGAVCCALYTGDDQWYRALILNADLPNLTVMYVDYGNEEEVSAENLKVVDDNIVNKLRTQAVPCRLAGFEGKSDSELECKFEDLVLDKTLMMHVIQFLKEVPCLVVRLIDENGVDVSKLLSSASSTKTMEVKSASTTVEANSRAATNGWDSTPNQHRIQMTDHQVNSKDNFQKEPFHDPKKNPEAWGIGKGSSSKYGHCDRTDNGNYQRDDGFSSNRSVTLKQNYTQRDLGKNDFPNSKKRFQNEQIPEKSQDTEMWNDSPQALFIECLTAAVGCRKTVVIVFATNPNDFYVQEMPTEIGFDQLMDKMENHYRMGGVPLPASERTVGAACVAKYSKDDSYYRAKILKLDRLAAEVFFVDYGNVEMVNFDNLKKIEASMVTVKGQAIHCKLMGVPHQNWSDDKNAEFISLLDLESLEAEFTEVNNNIYSVILRNTTDSLVINESFGATAETMLCSTSIVTSVKQHPNLPVGSSYDVVVSWCETPGRFYVNLNSTEDEFKRAMIKLQKDYKQKTPLPSPSIGQVVVALYKNDGAMYRGLIKIQKGNAYGIQYIDYGNRGLVDPSNIYGLMHQHSILPARAILCSLHGVCPPTEKWVKDPEIPKLFNGSFTCTIVQSSEDSEIPYKVTLTQNGQDLSELLIAKELAKPDVPEPSESQDISEPLEKPGVDYEILVGQTVPAHVECAEESRIFVSFELDALSQMRQDVTSYPSEELHHLPPEKATTGQTCIVLTQFSEYRRAVITCGKSTAGVAIRFMDYGSGGEYSGMNLFTMPPKFCSVPALVHDFTVTNVPSNKCLETIVDQNVVLVVDSLEEGRLTGQVLSACGQPLPFLTSLTSSDKTVLAMAILKRKVKVMVAHASGCNVWLQQVRQADAISKFLDDIYEAYEDAGEPFIPTEAGVLCAAKSDDGNWYRALVEDISSEGTMVQFIDYGNSERLPATNLKILDKFFDTPAFAIKASLPLLTEDEEIGADILNIAGEKNFTAVFVKGGEGWLVELLDGDEEFSVKLVRSGKALSMENNPFPQILCEPDPSLDVGNSLPCIVSYVASCSEFYVHLNCLTKKLQKMQDDLQTLAYCMLPLGTFPEVGCKVMAKSSEDEAWYRGEVRPEQVIHFLDYGNDECVPLDSLKVLPPAMDSVPKLAVKCSLVAPVNKKWSLPAGDKLEEYLNNDPTSITIESVQGETFVVDVTNSAGVCISKLLAEEGLLEDTCVGGVNSEVIVTSVNSPGDFWVKLTNDDNILMHCSLYLPSHFSDWSHAAKLLFKRVTEKSCVFQMVTLLPGDPTVVNLTTNGMKIDQELLVLCNQKTWQDAPVEATVVFSNSPSDFFIHLSRDDDAVMEMASNLEKANEFDPISDRSPGTICAALFAEDNLWYRAKILSEDSNGILVKFIDYGNTAVTFIIKALPLHLQDIPPIALHCTLPMPDSMSEWSDAAAKQFEELTEKTFEVELLSSEEPFVANLKYENVYVVYELGAMSGVDLSTVEQLIADLKSSMETVPSPKGKESEVKLDESRESSLQSPVHEVITDSKQEIETLAKDDKDTVEQTSDKTDVGQVNGAENTSIMSHLEKHNIAEGDSDGFLINTAEQDSDSLLNETDLNEAETVEIIKTGVQNDTGDLTSRTLSNERLQDDGMDTDNTSPQEITVVQETQTISPTESQQVNVEETIDLLSNTTGEDLELEASSEGTCPGELVKNNVVEESSEVSTTSIGNSNQNCHETEVLSRLSPTNESDVNDAVQVDDELDVSELMNGSIIEDLPSEDKMLMMESQNDSVVEVTPADVVLGENQDDSVVDITPSVEIPIITLDDSLQECQLDVSQSDIVDSSTSECAITSTNDVLNASSDPGPIVVGDSAFGLNVITNPVLCVPDLLSCHEKEQVNTGPPSTEDCGEIEDPSKRNDVSYHGSRAEEYNDITSSSELGTALNESASPVVDTCFGSEAKQESVSVNETGIELSSTTEEDERNEVDLEHSTVMSSSEIVTEDSKGEQVKSLNCEEFSEVMVSMITYPNSKCCEMDIDGEYQGHCVVNASEANLDFEQCISGTKLYTFSDCDEHCNNIVDVKTTALTTD